MAGFFKESIRSLPIGQLFRPRSVGARLLKFGPMMYLININTCAKFQLIPLSRLGDIGKTKMPFVFVFLGLLLFWINSQNFLYTLTFMASSLGHSHKLKICLPFLYIEFEYLKGPRNFYCCHKTIKKTNRKILKRTKSIHEMKIFKVLINQKVFEISKRGFHYWNLY